MADEISASMNLDLNLGLIENRDDGNERRSGLNQVVGMNLEDWLDGPVLSSREAVRPRSQRRLRLVLPPEIRNRALEIVGSNELQIGEGGVAAEERRTEVDKSSENAKGNLEDRALGKKEDGEKNNGVEGSFFDCNICLDLAKDPVVTCCGHLFCWPCLYRWLHYHSDAKECPVCKGEVIMKNVIPIYGSGSNTQEQEVDSSLEIPRRPQAGRVESWRQTIQRNGTLTMEEMAQHLGLSREQILARVRNSSGLRESPFRSNTLLTRLLNSRGIRRERGSASPTDEVDDLTESNPGNFELGENHRLPSLLDRRSNSIRPAILSDLTSGLSDDENQDFERLAEYYLHDNHVISNQEQHTLVDDRDSMSSIAAVIHSESHTVDNAVEIDSRVLVSTSTSQRRNDASRISDVDSGDSRLRRRRRLN